MDVFCPEQARNLESLDLCLIYAFFFVVDKNFFPYRAKDYIEVLTHGAGHGSLPVLMLNSYSKCTGPSQISDTEPKVVPNGDSNGAICYWGISPPTGLYATTRFVSLPYD